MRSPWIWFGFSSAVFAIIFLGLNVLLDGPSPPQSDFDPVRAHQLVSDLIPENKPHPLGSAENRLVRERIENKLTALGYSPQIQATVICSEERSGCAAVENLYAIKTGRMPDSDAILVSAHYDSTLAGPGAADDLAAAAAMLEVMELLQDENYLNDIIFLFADAEEAGLWGARAFAENNAEMARVKFVINLEARGVAGPSAMFETSVNNHNLIKLFSGAASRPFANSLTYEVYRKMPNDTDMSIYRKTGAAGLNFAFTGGVSLYHTSRDDPAHLSLRSLAHHGDNLLTTLRAAGDTPLGELNATGDAVYFDLFGRTLIYWPSWLTFPLLLVTLVLIIIAGKNAAAFRPKAILSSVAAYITALVVLGLVGWLLVFPLALWPAAPYLDHPHPWPGRIALAAACLLIPTLIAPKFNRSAGFAASLFAAWTIITLLGFVLAATLPGASYLTLAPALLFAIAAIIERAIAPENKGVIASHIGFIAAVYFALYHFLAFEVVLGFHLSHFKALLLFMPVIAGAPLVMWHTEHSRRTAGPAFALLAVTLTATLIASQTPAYTFDRPRSMNFAYEQIEDFGGERTARWRLQTYGPDAGRIAEAAGFPSSPEAYRLYNVYDLQAYVKPAQDLGLPLPSVAIESVKLERGKRIIQGTLTPGRNGPYFGIAFEKDAAVERFTVNEIDLLTAEKLVKTHAGALVMFLGMDQAIPFEIVAGEEPLPATLYEVSAIPDNDVAAALQQSRPETAVASGLGDYSEIQKLIEF